ncbi:alpha/beta fold hydrolase [Pseudoalteromonas sp. SWN29]|uniref:alpha/beta fold hydrolase n=1 Tax=Pseudoalteromonas sp. SWN29 TaxID=2792064 RepID=UPI001E3DDA50|nr:hypothetical protein [Pseudoalteromonas sp. SWN29]
MLIPIPINSRSIYWNWYDPAFIAAGAKAYLKDVPNAELHLLNAGHFSVEEKPVEIAKYIVDFMDKLAIKNKQN